MQNIFELLKICNQNKMFITAENFEKHSKYSLCALKLDILNRLKLYLSKN